MTISLPFLRPTPHALVRRIRDLPPAPKVLHKLQQLVSSPTATIRQIAEVVQLEPGLAARVVKMAQGTRFGRGVPSASIAEAIQRVGLAGVHELVTYAVAAQLVGRPLHGYGLAAQALWSRAVACAIAASSLAERSDVDRGDAYTAGLMHGIGLLVIDRHATQKEQPRLESVGYPWDFAPAERAWLGFSHAEAGAALLELWGFSAPVIAAVRYQLEPEEADAGDRKLSMVVATARWARSLFCVPEEKIPELPAAHWLEEAGVQIGDFGEWLGTVRRRYQITCGELRLG